MSFWQALNKVLLKKYATFDGRASRSEFWFFFLFCVELAVTCFFLMHLTFDVNERVFRPLLLMAALLLAGCCLPLLAVLVRRFHDVGRSFWQFLVLAAIPVLGWIVLVFLLVNEGQEGGNRFGSDSRW